MFFETRPLVLCAILGGMAAGAAAEPAFRIVTLDPGHFHAALVHRDTYPDVDERVHVYAPLGWDLMEHLKRIQRFNERAANPTRWQLEVHAAPEPLARLLRDKAGNVVVFSGRNRGKIEGVLASVGNGLHALVDKPWILRSADLPKVKETLALAQQNGVVAYDMMTERYEVTTQLQKELVNDPVVFGKIVNGTPEDPAVVIESIHHLMKTVAGAPLIRPAWFFDTEQQGEAIADVGTHLADLVPWTLWPGQVIDVDKDIRVISALRWPTRISRDDFRRVTGESDFPDYLKAGVKEGALDYFCNGHLTYTVRGVHVKLAPLWDWEAPAGSGDSHYAVYRGSKARIEVRQGAPEGGKPQTYVVATNAKERAAVLAAVRKRLAALQGAYPGVTAEEQGTDILLKIPDALRTSHEDHFAQVARQFFKYAKEPSLVPQWETANMLAKYHVTTKGTELSRETTVRTAPRLTPR